MTEFKPVQKKPRKRDELSLKQKTWIGIGLFILLTILTFQVFIPMFSRLQGRRMADAINEVITEDHFELMAAERQGIQFFSSFQSTRYNDLYISTDIAPPDLTPARIRFLYERALTEKPGTMRRFTMATDDSLYDDLITVMGDELLRVIGSFDPAAPKLVEFDEPFVLGKLPGYVPVVDIQAEASDERFLQDAGAIAEALASRAYNSAGLAVAYTTDRKTDVVYRWIGSTDGESAPEAIRAALARLRGGEAVDELIVSEDIYYDYPYNHDFTLPARK